MVRPQPAIPASPLPIMDDPRPPHDSDWDLIRDAGNPESPTYRQSRDEVTVRYYAAIVAYVRQTGRNPDESRELAQGFIADVLLGRDLLTRVDDRRGQFRTLLMHAVRNYVNDRYRHDHAARRHPGQERMRALDAEGSVPDVSNSKNAPEHAFHREWVRSLIDHAADSLHRECQDKGREWAWDIFQSRILLPMLNGQAPTSYESLMDRWQLKTAAQVANTIVQMRHAFVRHLMAAVGTTVKSPQDAREELRRLLMAFERSAS
ncbi:MAG: hypothetical protein U0636_06475 [Phycisphaerales bacterium]